ncbi:MAG TPA: polymer-forming cytoskeletal protein [Ideonella sp.]|uniref:polymer-forming cytoskeletal protein n=1 Tax=Ideonella sp. TaxID=1929293 RepID=UPI002E2F7482|nr:polymer-forming cytoskeletal protein [Ideonella sp.]HEX5683635.1 polymer-forming cytoskeletal protein [Ideonella sp.]
MLDKTQDTLVIDPVKMNIVNRIAADTVLAGDFLFKGGLLLQGTLQGVGEIAGRLVVWHDARLIGRFRVLGDLYLLGQLGEATETDDEVDDQTEIEVQGTAYVASSGVSTGTLIATKLRMYDGAVLQGPFRTLRNAQSLPVLHGG